MREILFRGKREDDGEWIEGFYLIKKDPLLSGVEYHYILIQEKDNCGCLMSHITWAKVTPETVGQYIGLTDKDGTRIFEGDILKVTIYTCEHIGRVIFNESTSEFEFWYNGIVGAYGEKATFKRRLSQSESIEVIGNIHDNPELLEM